MARSSFITSQKNEESPILIVDRVGIIGDLLVKRLKDESLVVFVSQKQPSTTDNVVHIPFFKKIPTIPDNTYSYIFVVDDKTKSTKDSLPSFVKKAQSDKGVFLFATHIDNMSQIYVRGLMSAYPSVKVIIFGDVFFKDIIYDRETVINKFIYEAENTGKITIPGDGTGLSFPIFAEDLVTGIFEAVFGEANSRNLFYLFPKHGVANITLAHMIQKHNPSVSIDFIKEKKVKQDNYVFYPEGVYFFENYPLEERVKKIELKDNPVVPEAIKMEKEKRGRFFLPFLWLVFCIGFFLLLPLITTLGFSYLGLRYLESAKNSIDKGKLPEAEKDVIYSNKLFALAQGGSIILYSQGQLIGQPNIFSGINNDVGMGKNLSTAGIYLIEASKYLMAALKSSPSQASSNFTDASNNLKNAIVIFEKEKAQGQDFSGLTEKIDPLVQFASNTISIWPDVLGYNGKRTYMVLFQNNMELRPGGGFIGSYGILALDNGRITSFKIYDVYDADGQLKGHIEPPFAIRRYMASKDWYLRDSNFNVNFVDSAAQAANFLNIEKGEMVNGVIGVDLSFVKNILSAMGNIYVPEYKQTVNADNVFQLTESHAEKNFFPGSTQKKDFLRALLNAMENKISSQKGISYLALAKAVGDSLSQKHILFAFDNSSIQNLFTVNGWSSAIWDDRKQSPTAVNDFIGINEANLGINKDNYFIRRSESEVVNIDDKGNVEGSITVAYKNTNTDNIWPGGIYKDYLRFILPLGATVSEIKINGQSQKIVNAVTNPQVYENTNFVPPGGLEVESYNQDGKTIYGFLTIVPVNSLQTIELDYSMPEQVQVSSPEITYDLKVFKQPGTDTYPFDFSLTYPSSYKIISTTDGQAGDSRLVYSTNLNSDKEISVDLVKK